MRDKQKAESREGTLISQAGKSSCVTLVLYFVILLGTVCYIGFAYGKRRADPELTVPPLLIGALLIEFVTGTFLWLRANRRLGRESRRVAETATVEQLPVLLDALCTEFQDSSGLLLRKVLTLLPQVKEGHSDLFQARHRFALQSRCNYVLRQQVRTEYALSWAREIFRVLPLIGTQEELNWMGKILKQEFKDTFHLQIQRMAQECQPLLAERVARLSNRDTLLRASSADMDGADTLLRPATSTQEPAELLLRADGKSD